MTNELFCDRENILYTWEYLDFRVDIINIYIIKCDWFWFNLIFLKQIDFAFSKSLTTNIIDGR